jgi:hypothetical protein
MQRFTDSSLNFAPPIVREQLQKAGVRLAHLLDSAVGK